jgi:hypothetical protein
MYTLVHRGRRSQTSYANGTQDINSKARQSRSNTRPRVEDNDSDCSLFLIHDGRGKDHTANTSISAQNPDDVALDRVHTASSQAPPEIMVSRW